MLRTLRRVLRARDRRLHLERAGGPAAQGGLRERLALGDPSAIPAAAVGPVAAEVPDRGGQDADAVRAGGLLEGGRGALRQADCGASAKTSTGRTSTELYSMLGMRPAQSRAASRSGTSMT